MLFRFTHFFKLTEPFSCDTSYTMFENLDEVDLLIGAHLDLVNLLNYILE